MFRAASDRHMSVNSAIITIDSQGAIQSVDKGACQMFGYELEELMGQKVNKLLPTPYREQHDAYLQNYHNTGRKRIIGMSRLVEGQHKDGSIFPIRLAVSEVQMGSTKMFIGMIDRVEDTAGTVTANNEGTIISCNKQCEAIWGYSVSELVGKNLCILMPSPHREHHDVYIANYRRTGTMKVINHTRNVPARHKNGTVFPVSLQVTKLKVGVVELFKGRVEKVDTEMEAVFTLDKHGKIVSCNRNFVAPLFGYTDTELIGKHIRVLVPSLTKGSGGKINIDAASSSSSSINTSSTAAGDDEEGSSTSSNRGSRKRKRSVPAGGEGSGGEGSEDGAKDGAAGNGGEARLESEHSIETQANELQNEMSAHALRERKGKERENDGEAEEDNSGKEMLPDEEPTINMESSWSLSGRRRLQVRHKDGSVFPVDFSISKFTKDDTVLYSGRIRRVDETDTSMTEGEESSGHALQDNNLVGDYIVEGNVGQGSYGKVKLACHRTTRHQVAIKILQKDLMDSAEQERSRREIAIQRKLIHPNIAKLYDVIESEDRINIVMEYSEGGELLTYITKQGKLNENEARRLFLQLLSAVQYCHSHNIIHRDIKHKNILLDGAKNIKLIDFGLSNYSQVGALRSTFCGTPAYAAPEMILAKKYVGPEVDVWSMGVVLFTMLAGRFPFGNVSHIIDGQYTLPETISPVLADLIRKMLTVDTEKRITVNEINMHPWVALGGKELPPLRPFSLGPGMPFGSESPVMANTGEWSHHSTPTSMLAQEYKPPAGPAMYLRSHYQQTSYAAEQPSSGQSTHAPVRILPKTPPQQVSEYASYGDAPASHGLGAHGLPPMAMPGISAMHGIGGMHPIGGMHAMQGMGGGMGPMVLPGLPMGAAAGMPPPPSHVPPYYGYTPATAIAAHQTAGAGATTTATSPADETNGAMGKRRKMEMAYGSTPPAPPQYYRAPVEMTRGGLASPPPPPSLHAQPTAAAPGSGRGSGGGGPVKDVSCSVISTVTDGDDAEGLNNGRA